MRSVVLIIGLLLLSKPSWASVILAKEYPFAPKAIDTISQSLDKARSRSAAMQNYPVAYAIDDGIHLWCLPNMPRSDGSGCTLAFSLRVNDLTITIQKTIALGFTAEQVQAKLADLDPNTTGDHQHFGSPFGAQDTSGSHYYCRPEGQPGEREWRCFLYVLEKLGG